MASWSKGVSGYLTFSLSPFLPTHMTEFLSLILKSKALQKSGYLDMPIFVLHG